MIILSGKTCIIQKLPDTSYYFLKGHFGATRCSIWGLALVGTIRVDTVRVGTIMVGTLRVGTVRVGTIRVGIIRVGTVSGHHWALLGTAGHICANFATCSWEPLTMLNPHFVAGEHGLFGGHKSEDIRTFLL